MVTFGQRIRFQAKCWRQMNFHTNFKFVGESGSAIYYMRLDIFHTNYRILARLDAPSCGRSALHSWASFFAFCPLIWRRRTRWSSSCGPYRRPSTSHGLSPRRCGSCSFLMDWVASWEFLDLLREYKVALDLGYLWFQIFGRLRAVSEWCGAAGFYWLRQSINMYYIN